jgi:ferredoxin
MGTCQIEYDKTKCIGAANCVAIAPETWELGKDGLAIAKIVQFSDKDLEKNMNAAIACPTHAIEIVGPDGKKLV